MFFKAKDIFKVCENGSIKDLTKLIRNGVNLDQRNRFGMTPLHVLAALGRLELARLVIQAGADRFAKDNEGKTPLDWAQERIKEDLTNVQKIFHLEDQRASTRALVDYLQQYLAARIGTDSVEEIKDTIFQLMAYKEYDYIDDKRIVAEFSAVEDLIISLKTVTIMHLEIRNPLISLMKGYGPRQVAYHFSVLENKRRMKEFSNALA